MSDAKTPSENPAPLIEGVDYIIDALGRWVFTREYHLKRGSCCGSGCVNCPGPAEGPFTEASSEGKKEP